MHLALKVRFPHSRLVKFVLQFCRSLSARVELKLDSINIQFAELDETAARLSERLEKHRSTLDQQVHEDQVWVSLLEDQ